MPHGPAGAGPIHAGRVPVCTPSCRTVQVTREVAGPRLEQSTTVEVCVVGTPLDTA